MLKRLYIQNVALITEADVEFEEGLNVLSGETGSGKSVILDSINFVLGSKADKSMIRFGEHESLVRAEFTVGNNSEAAKILEEFDIDCGGDVIISRKFNADGKGSIKINGNTVSASMLKELTQHLVDVHGQSEHFFLLGEENQLKVLDGVAGESCEAVKQSISEKLKEKREVKAKIAALGGDRYERERKLDLLKFGIDELERAEIRDGEFDELKSRQTLLANIEKIYSALEGVRSAISDDGGCSDALIAASRCMGPITDLDAKYADLYTRLDSLIAEADDIAETASSFTDDLTFDEREAQEIDDRLSLLKGIFKKYGGSESAALDFLEKSRAEYEALSDSEKTVEMLNTRLSGLDNDIFGLCLELTELRKKAAAGLCGGVVEELKTLNIPDARFEVSFGKYSIETANLNSVDGSDKIVFNFSANKGEPLKPLSKVISGGEMSRFMLAIKTRLKDLNDISTYIFDEIDAGISGFTARTVAEKFVNIAKRTQIIAVSHLAQVSAASDAQFVIYKVEEKGKTYTKIKKLTDEEKIGEIVRLTGSVDTDAARKHAKELISAFKK